MPSISRVLLPIDFSDRSVTAARYAIELAGHFHPEITLLHVLPPVSAAPHGYPEFYAGPLPGDLTDERRAQASSCLNDFLEQEFRGLPVNRVIEEGDPAARIVELAHTGSYDLIMMPTHGYGPFRRLLLGSVTAKVLHGAECPVWTGVHAPKTSPADTGLKHIACAVDLGPQSGRVLRWASWLAAEYQAALTLVHVVPLDPRTEGYYFSPEWRGHLIQAATADLEKLEAETQTHVPIHLELGEVHGAIRSAATLLGAGLLVIGRSPTSGVAGRLASHAYAIIRESPCPVVSV